MTADDRREPTKNETEEREEDERDRDEKKPKPSEPWAKIGSGNADSVTSD
jgi:hypothetical protein